MHAYLARHVRAYMRTDFASPTRKIKTRVTAYLLAGSLGRGHLAQEVQCHGPLEALVTPWAVWTIPGLSKSL